MRTLRVVISTTKGALPALVLATLLPGGASCSRTGLKPHGAPVESAGGAGGVGGSAVGPGPSSASGAGGFDPASSSSSGTGGGLCADPTTEQTIVVEVPPEGVPASPGQICAVSMSPVQSSDSARVTLVKDSQTLQLATGFIEIAPGLAGSVIGLPKLEVVGGWASEVLDMQVTNLQPTAGGFTFQAMWPQPFPGAPESWALMTVKTTLEIACDPGGNDNRTVEAITNVRLCDDQDQLAWMSSGEECTICRIIAEMAPSPIVPDRAHDDLPLARALRLRIVPLARVGRALVLLAENDGGPGLAYAWRPSAGEVEELAPDVVLWTPPDAWGPHQIQAAVHGDDGAAVASFTLQEAA